MFIKDLGSKFGTHILLSKPLSLRRRQKIGLQIDRFYFEIHSFR